MFGRVAERLTRPVDIAPLVWFRITGAVLIALEQAGALLTDYHRAYVEPAVHFSYALTPWLRPWPPVGVYAHFILNAMLAVCVAAGLRYRLVASALLVGLTSLFLMERSVYIHHAYLYCLYAGLFIFVPAHRALSLDVRCGDVAPSATAPAWALWILRFQIAVVYVFAGVAKLDPDWLRAAPLRLWLAARASQPVIGSVVAYPITAHALAWGGLLFDVLVVPALLWRRTVKAALVAAVCFHLINAVVFGIGTFPWFWLAATALFLPPDAFRRVPGLRGLPALAKPECDESDSAAGRPASAASRASKMPAVAGGVLATYALLQIVLPLRPLLLPGRAEWTEAGMTFAWRMMLRDKRGSLAFVVRDPVTGETHQESPGRYVTAWQRRVLVGTPDMILQFAHWLADRDERATDRRPEVRALSSVSLNGRAAQPLVDPRVNLAREPRRLGPYDWVVPLREAGD